MRHWGQAVVLGSRQPWSQNDFARLCEPATPKLARELELACAVSVRGCLRRIQHRYMTHGGLLCCQKRSLGRDTCCEDYTQTKASPRTLFT